MDTILHVIGHVTSPAVVLDVLLSHMMDSEKIQNLGRSVTRSLQHT